MTEKDMTIFYVDELNDDKGEKHVRYDVYRGKRKVHIERKGIYDFFSNLLLHGIVAPIITLFGFFTGVKWVGKKNLKKLNRKKGFFIYSNHAGVGDVTLAYLLSLPRRTNAVGYSDALENPVTHFLVPLLGFIPLPVDMHDFPTFSNAIKYYIQDRNQAVLIFPEAHIWPTYTGLRNFKRQSFRYPVENDAEVLPVFFARRKRKGFWKLFKKPRVTVLIGEPLKPDSTLSKKEAIQKLGDETYESMLSLCNSVEQEEYWKYIKIEK